MPKILSNKTNGFLQASSNDFSRFFLWETAKAVTTNPNPFFELKSSPFSPSNRLYWDSSQGHVTP